MAKSITINVSLDPAKGVSITTDGYSGSSCLAATLAIEAALGKTVSDETTSEFLKPMTQEQQALQ